MGQSIFLKTVTGTRFRVDVITNEVPRIHQFTLEGKRTITTVSLTAPSGSANRAVGSMPHYKAQKQNNPNYTTLDFRVEQYQDFF